VSLLTISQRWGFAAHLRKSGFSVIRQSDPSVPHRLEMPTASCDAAGATLEAIQQERSCEN